MQGQYLLSESESYHKFTSRDYRRLSKGVLNNSKSSVSPLYNQLEVLISVEVRQSVLAEISLLVAFWIHLEYSVRCPPKTEAL